METQILQLKGGEVFVTLSGEGQPLLCLHGWGKNVDSHAFDQLREALKTDPIQVIAPDLPGFGKSAEPASPWSVDDYADCIEELVRKLDLKNVHLLGHSFGGRIAIKLAARKGNVFLERARCVIPSSPAPCASIQRSPSPACRQGRLASLGMTQGAGRIEGRGASREVVPWISHLYLCAAAGVGRTLLIRRRFWLAVAKVGNSLSLLPGLSTLRPFARKCLYLLLRVRDYEEASEGMRSTMACIIEEDLTPCLECIEVPTDLFWGTEDTLTPLKDGELMNKKIVQSKLHVFPGVRHRVHQERAKEIAEVIRNRLCETA